MITTVPSSSELAEESLGKLRFLAPCPQLLSVSLGRLTLFVLVWQAQK